MTVKVIKPMASQLVQLSGDRPVGFKIGLSSVSISGELKERVLDVPWESCRRDQSALDSRLCQP